MMLYPLKPQPRNPERPYSTVLISEPCETITSQNLNQVGRGSGSSVGAREHELMMREMLIACSSLRGSGGAKQIISHGSQVTDQLYLGVDGRERGGTRIAGHGLHEAHLDLEGDGRRASSREEQEKGGSSAGDFESKLDKCRQQIRSLTADNRELFTRSAIAGHRHEVGPRQSKVRLLRL